MPDPRTGALRVLFYTRAAAREGQECFADYLVRGMPEGAVGWAFMLDDHWGERSGHMLREHGPVTLMWGSEGERRAQFRRVVQDFRPDVIHSNFHPGSRWSRELGLPLLVTIHGLTGGAWYGAEYADLAVGVSPAAVKGTDTVVLTGVKALEYVQPRRRRRGVFAHIGRLDTDRNPDLFLDALALVPEARGLVIGRANRRSFDVDAEAARRGMAERVEWLGEQPADEARAQGARADCVVCPCPVESFGMGTAELMTAGARPVVVEGPGYQAQMAAAYGIVTPATPAAFADGLRRALKQPLAETERRAMAAEAADLYSYRRMAEEYLALYRIVLAGRRKRVRASAVVVG